MDTRSLKNVLPIFQRTGIVRMENNKDKDLTANGSIPKRFCQKCKRMKCKGGLFSFLKISKSPEREF